MPMHYSAYGYPGVSFLPSLPLPPGHVVLMGTYNAADGTAECRDCHDRVDVDGWSRDICAGRRA